MKLYLPIRVEIKPTNQRRIPAKDRIKLENKKGLSLTCGSCNQKILDEYMVLVDIKINESRGGQYRRYVVHEKCADKNTKMESNCKFCNKLWNSHFHNIDI